MLSRAANGMRVVSERYREAYREDVTSWNREREELDSAESSGMTGSGDRADSTVPEPGPPGVAAGTAVLSEEIADYPATALRRQVFVHTTELGDRSNELGRLELAVRSLERTWLFLERGDATLLSDTEAPELPDDIQMRVVEAREAERSRLAQEIHDGPAQALVNAIFQAEYVDKVLDSGPLIAHTEIRFLRDRLRHELGDVRAFISVLRPPLLDQLGLNGSLEDAVQTARALTGATIETDLQAPDGILDEAAQVVVLRILQEALQNIRKHAEARTVNVATSLVDGEWTLEVRDDGRGFDTDALAPGGRQSFGLQFMRERAELVHARFEVQSRPSGGTVVGLAIPVQGDRR